MNTDIGAVEKSDSFTPMMKQYLDVKEQYKDCILMYRLGDFYEMFFDDAKTVSKELDLTLTGKNCGLDERAPMCGVPFHSADSYIARLIAKGYKVAICEQMEDPALAKGLVKREVVRLITPGTVIESSMLDESSNSFIASVYIKDDAAGIAVCDISTGEAFATVIFGEGTSEGVINELGRFSPKEVLLQSGTISDGMIYPFLKDKLNVHIETLDGSRFDRTECEETVRKQFKDGADKLFDPDFAAALCAAGGLMSYLHETQKNDLSHIDKIQVYQQNQFMELDYTARRNLELTSVLRSVDKKGSLLWVLDKTSTSAGARLIRQWIEKPLMRISEIMRRQYAVKAFLEHKMERDDLEKILGSLYDIERISGRIVYGIANGRDLRALAQVLEKIPDIKKITASLENEYLIALSEEMDELKDVLKLIDSSIVDDPPFSVREAGIIRQGFNDEADRLRSLLRGGADRLSEIEQAEKEKTGIPKLKVGYNSVFGYYIEVSKSFIPQVPDDYIRKQTLTNSERYITPELKKLEGEVVSANERLCALEFELFSKIRDSIAQAVDRMKRTSKAIAAVDCLHSFAVAAEKYNYVMPNVDNGDRIDIADGRHPVVERLLQGGMFVPNSVYLDCKENMIYVITGPNMAGKSTYMRQVALITIMAQCGSFVPASRADIGVCDRVFTRIGASDDMVSGQSTFMVEMNEVADILKNATSRSLLILDEIGRGTSTFDGMSIARAVIEYCASKKIGAKTLFATHYHELCEMEGQVPGIKNYNVAVKKRGKDIVFIKKIVRGGTSDSYGIDVARLAGLPENVIKRANEVLNEIETRSSSFNLPKVPVDMKEEDQVSFENYAREEIIDKLKKLEPDVLTPIEALTMLYDLTKKAKEC